MQYLAFNTQAPPFDDQRCASLLMAIDRAKIADLVLMGTASARVAFTSAMRVR